MFGKLGELAGMMKNLQGLKDNMEKMKNELAAAEYSAKSANGQVEAVATGEMVVKRIIFSPEFADCRDPQALELSALDAVNSALLKAKFAAAQKMSEATGGMNLPGIS